MSRVQSIERAFAVLGALADGPIGVTEVAERVDLPKSTAARLLASLAREGVVEQVPGDTRYRLGPRLVTLAARIRPNRSLATLARPSLEDLAGEAGEAAGLIRAGRRPRPLHRPGRQPEPGLGPRLDRVADPAPRRVVRAGAAGLRAADVRPALPRPPDGARSRPGRWSPPTPCSSGCGRSAATATRGRCEEFDEGISSVAAPVADGSGEVVAAVHLHGPSYRFPAPGDTDALAELVVASAARISESLRQAG